MNRIEQQKKDAEEKSKPYQDDEDKGELSNDMKALTHHRKKIRSIKVLHFLEKVKPELESHNLIVDEFNTNSFRITDGVKQVDYYPASNKMFTNKKEWRLIKGNIVKTLLRELT